ncbi:MAG: PQQ-binding-like beta-propeller repeat protein, partial [Gammaproteobacteria bacterium]
NVTSNAATLTVTSAAAAPSITTQPANKSVSVGATATFMVTATGTAPLSYQWSKNGTAIGGAVSASYTTPATVLGDSGATFTVKVTNSVGSVTSNAATLTVVTASGSVTVTPQLAPLTTSQTQQFTAVVPGAVAANWSVDAVGAGNATVGTISAGGVFTPGTQVGIHTIRATSSANSLQSGTATVAVTDLAGVYTYHNDAARTGQNLQEYALTPAVVGGGKFGKLWSCAVDGAVYAQPLYVANLAIAGGTHNVVFVATQHDSVYAFDADSPNCTAYWSVHPAVGVTSVPQLDTNCDDTLIEVGITGTPVIDPSTKILYFVAKSKEAGAYFQKLHAVNLATGAERSGSPVTITASDSKNTFDALRNSQKPGLALTNGHVYIGFSSHCDYGPYSGWFMSYDANSLTRTAAFDVTPNTIGGEGGIWMSGGAPAVDSSGSVYLSTGNGNFAYSTLNSPSPVPSNIDLGMSFIKFDPSNLLVQDFYSPTDEANWSAQDLDISSSGVTVLPNGAGPSGHPNLLIGSDKQANLWLLDRSNMGGFVTLGNNAVQQILLNPASCGAKCVFSTPVYYNHTIYIGNSGGFIVALPLVSGTFGVTPNNGYAFASSQSNDYYGFPGPTPMIGAAPGGGAVLWALDTSNNGTGGAGVGAAMLRAYDASNLGTRLFSSDGSSDTGPDAIKFAVPVVANGHVYVGGSNLLVVYGPR